MSNVEKFATPINNRNIVQPVKEQKSRSAQITDFQETSKVRQTLPDSELNKQQNGIVDNQRGPAAFMNLLTDPDVTVGFMKNIYMMMDIVALLPLHNDALTKEIEQLFSRMMISPQEIPYEMFEQENASTAFKGEIFDFLRGLIDENKSPQMKDAVISVLKSINSEKCRDDILSALSGSFRYLSSEMKPSREISARLFDLSERFYAENASENYHELKNEALSVLKDMEYSILYSERSSRLVSMIRYDLSRFNDNKEFLTDSVNHLMTMIREEDKPEFLQMLYNHLSIYENRNASYELSDSKVMNVMTEILKLQSENEDIRSVKSESVESIIHSILSSPSNFTPLLHYIIPVEYEDVTAFAEIWIDPDEEEKSQSEKGLTHSIHMLIVFDIDNLGKMETELYVRDKNITLSIYCPEESAEYIRSFAGELRKCTDTTDYRIEEINIQISNVSRSLVDVFEGLSLKRSGINVRI